MNPQPAVQHRARLRAHLCMLAHELRAFPQHVDRRDRVAAVRADLRQVIEPAALALLVDALADVDAPVRTSTDQDRPLLAIDRPRVASSAA